MTVFRILMISWSCRLHATSGDICQKRYSFGGAETFEWTRYVVERYTGKCYLSLCADDHMAGAVLHLRVLGRFCRCWGRTELPLFLYSCAQTDAIYCGLYSYSYMKVSARLGDSHFHLKKEIARISEAHVLHLTYSRYHNAKQGEYRRILCLLKNDISEWETLVKNFTGNPRSNILNTRWTLYYALWRRVVWYKFTNISVDPIPLTRRWRFLQISTRLRSVAFR